MGGDNDRRLLRIAVKQKKKRVRHDSIKCSEKKANFLFNEKIKEKSAQNFDNAKRAIRLKVIFRRLSSIRNLSIKFISAD